MRRGYMQSAAEDLDLVLERVDGDDLQAIERAILDSRHVFVTGLGRTGLMARGFAMRLMHLGRTVFHVGDVITPSIQEGDLLVICSRTGKSKVLSHYIRIARKAKAGVVVVTAHPDSPVAAKADVVLPIDDTPRPRPPESKAPLPPLGSLFEQALLIVLDQIVLDLMQALDLTEDDMAQVHTEFE